MLVPNNREQTDDKHREKAPDKDETVAVMVWDMDKDADMDEAVAAMALAELVWVRAE